MFTGAFTPHFLVHLGVPEEFRPEFYKEFCVRQIGTKSPSWSLSLASLAQNDLFKRIWPPHARRPGPLVTQPQETADPRKECYR